MKTLCFPVCGVMINPIKNIKKIIIPLKNNFFQLKLWSEKISHTKIKAKVKEISPPRDAVQNSKDTRKAEITTYPILSHLFSDLKREYAMKKNAGISKTLDIIFGFIVKPKKVPLLPS